MTVAHAAWNRNDVALVLIDYQPEQFASVTSSDKRLIETNARFVARIAKAYSIPIVLSTVAVAFGLNKPTVDGLLQDLPGLKEIDRSSMNAWEDAAFREAIEKTGKKKLVMAGLWTEICLTYPVIDAIANGYQVMIITDAVGGTTPVAHNTAVQRMVQASAIPQTAFAFAAEMCPDWADPLAHYQKDIGGWYFGELAAASS